MFFLFGSPRSGTTLLNTTLNMHSQICLPLETDFIVPLCLTHRRIGDEKAGKKIITDFINNSPRSSHALGEFLSAKEITSIIQNSEYTTASMLDNLYTALAQKAGKSIGGDKSPNDLNYVNDIINAKTFNSNIKVVHLVRDIHDVLFSIHNAKMIPMNHSKKFFPRLWSERNLYLNARFEDKPDQYHLVRYEDFVREPETEIKKICTFLGVEFEENMLSTNRTKKFDGEKAHANLNKPFDPSRIGRGKREMPENVVEHIQSQAAEGLRTFGYID